MKDFLKAFAALVGVVLIVDAFLVCLSADKHLLQLITALFFSIGTVVSVFYAGCRDCLK